MERPFRDFSAPAAPYAETWGQLPWGCAALQGNTMRRNAPFPSGCSSSVGLCCFHHALSRYRLGFVAFHPDGHFDLLTHVEYFPSCTCAPLRSVCWIAGYFTPHRNVKYVSNLLGFVQGYPSVVSPCVVLRTTTTPESDVARHNGANRHA